MGNYDIEIRQPAAGDIIGTNLSIAALGTAFEATFGWRLTSDQGLLDEGYFDSGSTAIMGTFVNEVPVKELTYVGPATFELFGDTGADQPGSTAVKVPVVVVPGAAGYVPYVVEEGDTLTKIAGSNSWSSTITTVESIVAANDLANPDYIEVGQVLRLPV